MPPPAQAPRLIRPAPTQVPILGSTYVNLYKSIETRLRSSTLLQYKVDDLVLESQLLQELEKIPGQHREFFENLGRVEKDIVLLSIGRRCVRNNRLKMGGVYQHGQPGRPSSMRQSYDRKFRRLDEDESKRKSIKREYGDTLHGPVAQLSMLQEEADPMMGVFADPDPTAAYNFAPINQNDFHRVRANKGGSPADNQNELVRARERYEIHKATLQGGRGAQDGMAMGPDHHP